MDQVRAEATTAPARSMPGMGDHPSATGLYAAIVTALYRREKTGLGGVVKSSLLQNGLWANGCAVQTRLFNEHIAHRPTREEAPNALANHYKTRDGRWFIMALFNEQRQLRGFLAAIGREDLANDLREDESHPNGTVVRRDDGLLIGYIDRFGFTASGARLVPATHSWHAICRRAYELWNNPDTDSGTS